MAGGPREVQAACEDAVAVLAGAFAGPTVTGSRDEWAGVAGSLQRVIDVACAAQDAAIVRLAAIEPELLEDGTVVESHRAPGHVALDAPAIVSGVLAVSAVHAERRVRTAVRLAADGAAGTGSGLGGLHAAMAAGRLDAYRAGVLAHELEEAPAQVRATVVAALDAHLHREDGAHLRRRCRRALARISPDLLRQRAVRARAGCGLRRWAEEPGVDRWEGTFPTEDAAHAWAAIDALARRYVTDAVCPTIERARAKALTDLVAGNATIDTVITLTVPATVLPDQQPPTSPDPEPHPAPSGVGDHDLVEVTGLHASQPVLVSHRWLTTTVADQRARDHARVVTAPCHPGTGAVLDPDPVADLLAAAAAVGAHRYRPSARLVKLVRSRDRRCRFPGCTVAAVFCDLDHVRPWPLGPTTAENLICLCRRHHRIKQRPGWRVTLTADVTTTWTDPTGRVRTTTPVNALQVTVLTGAACSATSSSSATPSRPRTLVPDGPHSSLEFLLEHLGAAPPGPSAAWRGHHGRRVDVTPRSGAWVRFQSGRHRPHRRTAIAGRDREPENPPF